MPQLRESAEYIEACNPRDQNREGLHVFKPSKQGQLRIERASKMQLLLGKLLGSSLQRTENFIGKLAANEDSINCLLDPTEYVTRCRCAVDKRDLSEFVQDRHCR